MKPEKFESMLNLHKIKKGESTIDADLTIEELQDKLKITEGLIKILESNADFKVNKHIQQQHSQLKGKEKQLLEEIELKKKK